MTHLCCLAARCRCSLPAAGFTPPLTPALAGIASFPSLCFCLALKPLLPDLCACRARAERSVRPAVRSALRTSLMAAPRTLHASRCVDKQGRGILPLLAAAESYLIALAVAAGAAHPVPAAVSQAGKPCELSTPMPSVSTVLLVTSASY